MQVKVSTLILCQFVILERLLQKLQSLHCAAQNVNTCTGCFMLMGKGREILISSATALKVYTSTPCVLWQTLVYRGFSTSWWDGFRAPNVRQPKQTLGDYPFIQRPRRAPGKKETQGGLVLQRLFIDGVVRHSSTNLWAISSLLLYKEHKRYTQSNSVQVGLFSLRVSSLTLKKEDVEDCCSNSCDYFRRWAVRHAWGMARRRHPQWVCPKCVELRRRPTQQRQPSRCIPPQGGSNRLRTDSGECCKLLFIYIHTSQPHQRHGCTENGWIISFCIVR